MRKWTRHNFIACLAFLCKAFQTFLKQTQAVFYFDQLFVCEEKCLSFSAKDQKRGTPAVYIFEFDGNIEKKMPKYRDHTYVPFFIHLVARPY